MEALIWQLLAGSFDLGDFGWELSSARLLAGSFRWRRLLAAGFRFPCFGRVFGLLRAFGCYCLGMAAGIKKCSTWKLCSPCLSKSTF